MSLRSRSRVRDLVRCVRCGQLVARSTAFFVPGGWVGKSCLRSALSAARIENKSS